MVAGGEQSHCGIGRKKTIWKNLTLPFPSPLFSIFPVIYFTPRCVWRNGILEVFLPPPLHRPETAAAAYLMHYQCSALGLGFAKHFTNTSNGYIRHWILKKPSHFSKKKFVFVESCTISQFFFGRRKRGRRGKHHLFSSR